MAGGTLAAIQSGNSPELFYWLKISGIPFMFFSVIDPTDVRKWGGAAWTLSSGYSAVPGMGLPDQTLTQTLPDIIGGIASAESIKLTLLDFEAYDSAGPYNVLSRLFSPGIATSTPGGSFELASDIPSSAVAGASVSLRTGTITPAAGYYTVGSETLQLGSFGAPVAGISTGVIVGARNRFPCASTFPVVPYHRVVRDETNGAAIGRNILVTPMATPFTMYGRTAAFYIGAMQPSGVPMVEGDMMCRLIGRIKSIGYGDVGGASASYEISITSIVDDLSGALLAPGLAVAAIKPDQICLPQVPTGLSNGRYDPLYLSIQYGDPQNTNSWNSPLSVIINGGGYGTFPLKTVIDGINYALAGLQSASGVALGGAWFRPRCDVLERDGHQYVYFFSQIQPMAGGALDRYRTFIRESVLMWALGFEKSDGNWGYYTMDESVDADYGVFGSGHYFQVVAKNPAPSVFIPTMSPGLSGNPIFSIQNQSGTTSSTFLLDQGDGRAFVQLDNGALVSLVGQSVDIGVVGRGLTTGPTYRFKDGLAPGPGDSKEVPYYYCPLGTTSLVKQVVVAGKRSAPADAGIFVGRFLASNDVSSALDDYNYYAEGIGLGWNQVIDKTSFSAIASLGTSYAREAIVDNSSTLNDLITPVLKEYGIALVWNPETSQIAARPLRTPSAPGSHAVVLSESNRTKVGDRTKTTDDPSNVRSSWTLDWGWDPWSKQFQAPETTLVDNIVQSTAQALHKNEKIEDKTLVASTGVDAIQFLNEMVYSRSYLYQQPWRRCTRGLSLIGLTLAPGSYHQIIDNTIANPFTGKIGITASDALYGLLIGITSNPQQPQKGQCIFLVSRIGKASFTRKWSPVGMVDYTATGRGYNTGTGVLTMAKRYSSHAVNKDGWDFLVGDKCDLISWDNVYSGFNYSEYAVTVSAVAADGSTVTIDSGRAAIPVGVEVILVQSQYSVSSATRQASVAYDGSSSTLQIMSTAANVKWG